MCVYDCVCDDVMGRAAHPLAYPPTIKHTQPFEGGLGSYKLYILLGRYLKYAYKGDPNDAGAVLHVRLELYSLACLLYLQMRARLDTSFLSVTLHTIHRASSAATH